MASSQYSTSKRSSLVFDRTIGSLRTPLSPEDFFTSAADNDLDYDDTEESYAMELKRLGT